MFTSGRTRRAIAVGGVVQGVGFRPFVHGLAARFGLAGFVRNRGAGVDIVVEGAVGALDSFLEELGRQPPPLARVQELTWEERMPQGDSAFRIERSEPASGTALVSPDVAPCDECLRELFDPLDRRYRYPFINCTKCGPRLTIVTGTPYDRERTTQRRPAARPAAPCCVRSTTLERRLLWPTLCDSPRPTS
jgi:hydrogenase maturation protein HypF